MKRAESIYTSRKMNKAAHEERKAHRMADRRRDSWDHMAAVHEGCST